MTARNSTAPGKTATVKFDKPGTYTYICKDHMWSYGEITVE
jgi:plastocyanin